MSNKIQIGITIAALVLTIGIASTVWLRPVHLARIWHRETRQVIKQQIRLRLILLKFQVVHHKVVRVHLDLNTNFSFSFLSFLVNTMHYLRWRDPFLQCNISSWRAITHYWILNWLLLIMIKRLLIFLIICFSIPKRNGSTVFTL